MLGLQCSKIEGTINQQLVMVPFFIVRRLDSYISTELILPTAISSLIALFLLLSNRLFKLAPILVQADVPLLPFLEILALLIPPFLVTAVPIAFYMSTIVVGNRLVRTGEWGALLAAGISPARATVSVLVMAAVFAGVAQWAIWTINPQGRVQFGQKLSRLVATNAHRMLAAGEVHTLAGGMAVYFPAKSGGNWQQPVFVIDSDQNDSTKKPWVLAADEAIVEFLPGQNEWQFNLKQGWMWGSKTNPWVEFDALSFTTNPFGNVGRTWVAAKEASFAKLQERAKSPDKLGRKASAEIHSRILKSVLFFFLPLAAIALGIGKGNARYGKGEAFLRGLTLYGAFYLTTTASQKFAVGWQGPVWVPMYGAASAFAMVCIWMYYRVVCPRQRVAR